MALLSISCLFLDATDSVLIGIYCSTIVFPLNIVSLCKKTITIDKFLLDDVRLDAHILIDELMI